MKPKIFVTRPIPTEVEAYLTEYCNCKIWDSKEPTPHDVLLKEIQDVQGILTSGSRAKIDKTFLDAAPYLKIVSNIAVGYDQFDLEAMKDRNVIGTHTPHVLDETVADLVFGLMLGAARRIPELDRQLRNGIWRTEDDNNFGVDVHGKTLGIIGMGRIGEKIARRAVLGFNMQVMYYNRSRNKEVEEKLNIQYADLQPLLTNADYIVLMIPLTKETIQFIGEEEFNMMKPNAIFINCSRGQTVDEKALIMALQEEKIRGAGLDVFEKEPIDPDNPLLKLDNVVAVPHIGSATDQTRFDMAMLAAENLVAGVTGQQPLNVVKELKHLVV
ncbi:2-hydroxyacid dehydrogenase [Bacillus taeanensis]|uniref:Bifunctional glyoxylate/hydroxypyruvate reductase B n=1 Tax=Bacillus taeanensis TaxID=273032 RepID=A0A366XXJ7_9BACI|nr:D-glycerate dehydrogenase [Bacillus taeanensis]RBW71120.1 bifunctional glyoxylate/hydroxypyruvate reductase B [Bacillus taeanensis]